MRPRQTDSTFLPHATCGEAWTGQQLRARRDIGGAYVELFDPQRYITGPSRRDPRWRVDFNGLGSIGYFATVERTPDIDAAIASDVLGRVKAFTHGLDQEMMDRSLAWAYLLPESVISASFQALLLISAA